MATNLNLDNLSVDASGRATFSGLSSGIDVKGVVDGLIAARRIPIDSIEQRISDNEARIAILEDVSTRTRNLVQAADALRGVVSFDGSADIFEAKSSFASSSRTDTQSPSAAAEILGVTAGNRAQATSHTIEVQQIATAHKIASSSIAGSASNSLGLSGAFVLNGTTITLNNGESLLDLRDKINTANSGDSATGVTASIVSISSTEQVLTLTADKTGTDAAITVAESGGGNVLTTLGIVDNGGAINNELQAANNALIKVDGLDQVAGITTIERQNNTIDDVIEGVTLSLFKAEAGTTINLDIDRDLNQVKSAIVSLVDAYNELRTFVNTQAQSGLEDDNGEPVKSLLAGTRILSDIKARLSSAIGSAVEGASPTFSTLAEIGIRIQGTADVSNPLLANTLSIDETKLDEALLSQTDAVRDLFAFDFSSSSNDVLLVSFSDETGFANGGYQLNVAYSGGSIVSANINGPADGSDDGSVSVDGQRLTVTSGGAKGLKLLYSGTASASGIQLDISVGVGAQIHAAADQMLDGDGGVINGEIKTLQEKNTFSQNRVDTMNERLERERERLLERFARMESALSSMNNLLDSIRTQIDSAFGSS